MEHISNISSYALVNDYFQSRFFFVSFFESLEFWSFGAQTHDKSTLIYRCTYTHSKSAILLTSNQIKCTHPYGNFIDSCRNRWYLCIEEKKGSQQHFELYWFGWCSGAEKIWIVKNTNIWAQARYFRFFLPYWVRFYEKKRIIEQMKKKRYALTHSLKSKLIFLFICECV